MAMRSLPLAIVLAATGLMVASCADRSPSGPRDGSTFNFTNGPETPGPIVFRNAAAEFRVSYSDPVRGLTAIHGGDVVEFCLTGDTSFPLVDLQSVLTSEEQNRLLLLIRGSDIETTVWAVGDFDCDVFTTTTPVATGTVDLTNTDNDLFAGDQANHNAFGFVAQGTLRRSNGARAHFNGVSKCVWDGNDLATLNCNNQINLK
jgi:hypothetical protein